MPTSATGPTEPACGRSARPAAGFTLIEILVVIVIFGIAMGALALHLLPDDTDRGRREAERTALLLERLADEAESTGRVLAWHADGNRSQFEVPGDDGRWGTLAGDPEFSVRELAQDMSWTALRFPDPGTSGAGGGSASGGNSGGGSRGGGSGNMVAGGATDTPAERVIFLPGQPAPVFEITLATGASRMRLHGDSLGHVTVQNAVEPP